MANSPFDGGLSNFVRPNQLRRVQFNRLPKTAKKANETDITWLSFTTTGCGRRQLWRKVSTRSDVIMTSSSAILTRDPVVLRLIRIFYSIKTESLVRRRIIWRGVRSNNKSRDGPWICVWKLLAYSRTTATRSMLNRPTDGCSINIDRHLSDNRSAGSHDVQSNSIICVRIELEFELLFYGNWNS